MSVPLENNVVIFQIFCPLTTDKTAALQLTSRYIMHITGRQQQTMHDDLWKKSNRINTQNSMILFFRLSLLLFWFLLGRYERIIWQMVKHLTHATPFSCLSPATRVLLSAQCLGFPALDRKLQRHRGGNIRMRGQGSCACRDNCAC